MTPQELFGLPKWLTESEDVALADAFNLTYDVDIKTEEVMVISKVSVDAKFTSVQLKALDLGSDTRLFGQAGPHYVRKYPFSNFIKVGEDPYGYPYLTYEGPAPYVIDDIVADLRDCYGFAIDFHTLDYQSGDTIDPSLADADGIIKLKVDPNSIRLGGDYVPLYACPTDLTHLVRLINPNRHLLGYRNHFFETSETRTLDGELQYFSANGTRASSALRQLTKDYIFNEEVEDWDIGTKYLIPVQPEEGVEGWTSSKTPRFQNIYGAKVLYNGPLRLVDVKPLNTRLTHVLKIQLNPKYALHSTGVISIYYRLLGLDLSQIVTVTRLPGFVPVDNCPFVLLNTLIEDTFLDGLTLPE